MIKINLLPQKRAKRAGRAARSEPSSKQLFVGIGALAAVGALVFILVDKPKRDRLSELSDANEELSKSIAEKQKDLAGYPELQKSEKDAILYPAIRARMELLARGRSRVSKRGTIPMKKSRLSAFTTIKADCR